MARHTGKTWLYHQLIIYGMNITNLNATDVQRLQITENGVYWQVLGAPRYAPVCSLNN